MGNPEESIHKLRFGQPGTGMPATSNAGWTLHDWADLLAFAQTLPSEAPKSIPHPRCRTLLRLDTIMNLSPDQIESRLFILTSHARECSEKEIREPTSEIRDRGHGHLSTKPAPFRYNLPNLARNLLMTFITITDDSSHPYGQVKWGNIGSITHYNWVVYNYFVGLCVLLLCAVVIGLRVGCGWDKAMVSVHAGPICFLHATGRP
jgi:hypothetical protein